MFAVTALPPAARFLPGTAVGDGSLRFEPNLGRWDEDVIFVASTSNERVVVRRSGLEIVAPSCPGDGRPYGCRRGNVLCLGSLTAFSETRTGWREQHLVCEGDGEVRFGRLTGTPVDEWGGLEAFVARFKSDATRAWVAVLTGQSAGAGEATGVAADAAGDDRFSCRRERLVRRGQPYGSGWSCRGAHRGRIAATYTRGHSGGGTGGVPEQVSALAIDAVGRIWAGGISFAADLPAAGAFQPFMVGYHDGTIQAFSSSLDHLLFSTLLGGVEGVFDNPSEQFRGIAALPSGKVVATGGSAASATFPRTTVLGGPDDILRNERAIVCMLDPDQGGTDLKVTLTGPESLLENQSGEFTATVANVGSGLALDPEVLVDFLCRPALAAADDGGRRAGRRPALARRGHRLDRASDRHHPVLGLQHERAPALAAG